MYEILYTKNTPSGCILLLQKYSTHPYHYIHLGKSENTSLFRASPETMKKMDGMKRKEKEEQDFFSLHVQ